MGIFEGFDNMVVLLLRLPFTDDSEPLGIPHCPVIIQGFIHDIPPLYTALVAADNGHNMVFHAGQKGVPCQ